MKLLDLKNFFLPLAIMLTLGFFSFEVNQVFAEDNQGYLMAEDTSAHLTFMFRDGTETHEFPIFSSNSFTDNTGTFFHVQGVIKDGPLLHKALDDAYKFKFGSIDHPTKFFNVDVNFDNALGEYDTNNFKYMPKGGDDSLNDDEPRKTIHYTDCKIVDFLIETPTITYRGYFPLETGFATVETINFQCQGVTSADLSEENLEESFNADTEYPRLPYSYADDVRTVVTFDFLRGSERIEFPVIHMISGFGHQEPASFRVEGVPNTYPLLANAVDITRKSFGQVTPLVFDAKVEFIQETKQGEQVLREINYEDCHVASSGFSGYRDYEEGFLFAGGFVQVQTFDFDCTGITPANPRYDQMFDNTLGPSSFVNEQLDHKYTMASGLKSTAKFTFKDQSIEIIDFPIYRHLGILSESTIVFELAGIVGDYPLLYKQVDNSAKINQVGGSTRDHNLFEVDVILSNDEMTLREFSYSDCFVADYKVGTQSQNEEGFWTALVHENTFDFQCIGYHPKNPTYDALFVKEKADTLSSTDLREARNWYDAAAIKNQGGN